jgi:hypothetical protein
MTRFSFFIAMASCLLGGCALRTQTVKVPVPVPCVGQPLEAAALPLEGMTEAETQSLIDSGLYGVLADRVAAALILLQADRQALLAQQDACSKIPEAVSAPDTKH